METLAIAVVLIACAAGSLYLGFCLLCLMHGLMAHCFRNDDVDVFGKAPSDKTPEYWRNHRWS